MFVDEASTVADKDLFPMLNQILYSAYPHDINWSKMLFCGDPYQQQLNIVNKRPGPY